MVEPISGPAMSLNEYLKKDFYRSGSSPIHVRTMREKERRTVMLRQEREARGEKGSFAAALNQREGLGGDLRDATTVGAAAAAAMGRGDGRGGVVGYEGGTSSSSSGPVGAGGRGRFETWREEQKSPGKSTFRRSRSALAGGSFRNKKKTSPAKSARFAPPHRVVANLHAGVPTQMLSYNSPVLPPDPIIPAALGSRSRLPPSPLEDPVVDALARRDRAFLTSGLTKHQRLNTPTPKSFGYHQFKEDLLLSEHEKDLARILRNKQLIAERDYFNPLVMGHPKHRESEMRRTNSRFYYDNMEIEERMANCREKVRQHGSRGTHGKLSGEGGTGDRGTHG